MPWVRIDGDELRVEDARIVWTPAVTANAEGIAFWLRASIANDEILGGTMKLTVPYVAPVQVPVMVQVTTGLPEQAWLPMASSGWAKAPLIASATRHSSKRSGRCVG